MASEGGEVIPTVILILGFAVALAIWNMPDALAALAARLMARKAGIEAQRRAQQEAHFYWREKFRVGN